MKSILFVCLVASTVALKCFTMNDDAVETEVTCSDSETVCYSGSYKRGGTVKKVSGCGNSTVCEDVNEAVASRKKRAVVGCDAGRNTVMLETEGMNTLECIANYMPAFSYSDDEKARYCYNGVAWKKYEYEGSVAPDGFKVFSCNNDDWITVTFSTTSGNADLTAVVTMDGQVQTGNTLKVPTGTVLSVSCQFSTLTMAAEDEVTVTGATTIAECELGDQSKTPPLGDLVIMMFSGDVVEHPNYGTFADGSIFTLSCPADYFLTPIDAAVTLTSGTWSDTANYDCVNPTTYKVPAIPADRFQELWSESVEGNKLEVNAELSSNSYLRCVEGYEPSTDAAPWGGEIFVMLTFAQGAAQIAETNAATAAMLTYGQSATEWEPETIASCTPTVVAEKTCTVADLGTGMAKYGANTTTPQAEGEVDADVVVVVKCEQDGFKQEYTDTVELMSYKCNGATGSFGTVYALCLEYTDCETETCATDGCNSSSALFSLLCLVIPLLHMAVY